MNFLVKLIVILSLVISSCTNTKKMYNISDFGALGDSLSINTNAIQEAIDQCSSNGGGTVLIDNGIFISGTIILKDDVNLHISENAKLIGSKNPKDYHTIDPFTDATGQLRGKCLVGAENASNISISGKGTINGRGQLFHHGELLKTMQELGVDKKKLNEYASNRPFIIRLVKSKNITVKQVKLMHPAAWTLHIYQCENITVDGINIYSHAHKNNDGIDLDSSKDALIKNCYIDSGDDAICIKSTSPIPTRDVLVQNCKLKSDWGTIKFGTESMGDFKNILIEDCEIFDTRGGGIKILSMDGANIDSVTIRNIKMTNVEMPIFIRLGERLRTYRDAPKQAVGSINNIVIENITASVSDTSKCRVNPPSGMLITGTPNHKIGNIKLSNIDISLPGCGTKEMQNTIIAEDETRYPEFSFFGILPTYGMFARHINKLQTNNISFSLRNSDKRNESTLIDVNQ